MKQFLSLTISAAALIIAGTWKMAAQELPAGFKSGYIITTDGTRQEGLIKESFKSKASFVFQATTGKKVTYGGNGVKEVSIGGISYISFVNDFFKVISTGEKASLLQKMSDATGKIIYNGTDAAGISSGTEDDRIRSLERLARAGCWFRFISAIKPEAFDARLAPAMYEIFLKCQFALVRFDDGSYWLVRQRQDSMPDAPCFAEILGDL